MEPLLPGQYFDSETNLHYNWNRYYDTTLARYITSDPVGIYADSNTYNYVRSNPIRYYDPRGLYCVSLPSKSGPWENIGKPRFSHYEVLPNSFGGFGLCKWRKHSRQKQKRRTYSVKLCYECETTCDGEECSVLFRNGSPTTERRTENILEDGPSTNQAITEDAFGRKTGCCRNPWTGEFSCGGI